jgi:hypothetical protein
MAAVFGAIKGVSRGVILLVLVALLPGLAWLVAAWADGAFGLGFKTIFFTALALEGFLCLAALFGISSEVQQSHAETIEDAAASQREL